MLVLDGRIVLAEFISVILFTIKLFSENMEMTKMKLFRKMVSSLVEIAKNVYGPISQPVECLLPTEVPKRAK
ncbi:unnamed protein product, partial [Timema podura]|nr:unnamed protein product [Timema podura]